jgi:hypothetical protein
MTNPSLPRVTRRHAACALALVASSEAIALAYGEDFQPDSHSTAHYDVTRAMARCAGFAAADATTIAEANQVTDTLAYGATAFGFTDRAGPLKQYFHFPEPGGTLDANGDGALRSWASGMTTLTDADGTTLSICDAAGSCCDSEARCVTAGSLEAVGIWLHAVGDFWSHRSCTAAGGTNHTTFDMTDPAQSVYCPPSMHGFEWGARDAADPGAMLQANAILGLQAMRAAIHSEATRRGLVACGAISDTELVAFASATTSTLRKEAADALYATCDLATMCGPPIAGDMVPVIDAPASGCGCSSTLGGLEGACGLSVLGVVGPRLRRRRKV